jgi:predicted ATP-binding protein involved in virulence
VCSSDLSPAIVLIDEIEKHLHPSWEQKILPSLLKIFPNTQFIVTTHSPQVLTSIKPQQIRILDNGEVSYSPITTFGTTSHRILNEIFHVNSRSNNEVTKILTKYLDLVNNKKGYSDEAINLRNKLNQFLEDDPILTDADFFLNHYNAKNNNNG